VSDKKKQQLFCSVVIMIRRWRPIL